jgi:hypothetical protein
MGAAGLEVFHIQSIRGKVLIPIDNLTAIAFRKNNPIPSSLF